MAEKLEKKIAKRKEKKRLRKQEETLNNVSEGYWRRLGTFALWSGYTVNIEGEQEVVPIKKNTSRLELFTTAHNLKTYVRKKKQEKTREEAEKRKLAKKKSKTKPIR